MVGVVYLTLVTLLLGAAWVIFRILVRGDYRRLGRLAPLTSFLELLIWLLFVAFPYLYNPPDWPLVWFAEPTVGPAMVVVGSALTVGGMGLALAAMARLGVPKTMGRQTVQMERAGLYRLSRNPQIVGGGLAVLGTVLLWPSWYAVGWAGLYGVMGHLMVLTEEEHLKRLYGEPYARYCQDVARYLGWPRRG
ncbi:MAG: hypothetical protein GX605_14260 [Chloroflexi bacterium]|nr:hypothetical protein [Chloroflexota bacterium]